MARILVANDDPDLVAICQDILEADGHSVLGVVGGSDALKEAHRWSPDAILLDWQMPDMDGTTAIRVLRGDSRTASIPILMMSGADDGPQVAARAGADGFLAKPFDAEELSAAMKAVIARGVRSAERSEKSEVSLIETCHLVCALSAPGWRTVERWRTRPCWRSTTTMTFFSPLVSCWKPRDLRPTVL